jgi:DNA segregation ATPase FtsK/SpoIIIE, S-DNA-T family
MLEAGAIKLALSGASAAGAWVVWRSSPEQIMRRKLDTLLRTQDFYMAHKGYKSRELRSYPAVQSVRTYLDRTQAVFRIPVGVDPAEIVKRDWLFRQVFGLHAELTQQDGRTFHLSVYTSSVAAYEYEPLKVRECIQKHKLPVYVGRSRSGDVSFDMVEHPHLLIAGETGSGKSVALRSILTTLTLNRDNVELYCADMKRSEFHLFRGIAKEVVIDPYGLRRMVDGIVQEMRRRGDLMDVAEVAHVDDLPEQLPYIILAVDEVALLKKEKEIMQGIEEISTIGRALGVYLILSMQRPDSGVLDGKLKNNLTVRMAFKHADEINSRITIGTGDAAHLKQSGQCIYKGETTQTVQGPLLKLETARELLNPYRKTAESLPVSEPITEATEVEWGTL